MTNKKDLATVDDNVSLHELVKHESKRFQESKSPKMSEITAEEFKALVSGGGGAGEAVDYQKIRSIIREELAALLPATGKGEGETDTTEEPNTEEPPVEESENTEATAKRQRKSEK